MPSLADAPCLIAAPNLDRLIRTAAGEQIALWGDRHRIHSTRMSLKSAQQLPGLEIPNINRIIIAAANQSQTVPTDRNRIAPTHIILQNVHRLIHA